MERTALMRRLITAGGKIAALGYDESEDLEITLDRAETELTTPRDDACSERVVVARLRRRLSLRILHRPCPPTAA